MKEWMEVVMVIGKAVRKNVKRSRSEKVLGEEVYEMLGKLMRDGKVNYSEMGKMVKYWVRALNNICFPRK